MNDFKIGIMADSLKLSFAESIEVCARLGVDGVQCYAVSGEMSPDSMSSGEIKKKKELLKNCDLCISALCGDFGGHGFTHYSENAWRIEASKRILDLALSLDCTIVTTHIGVIPEDSDCETYRILQEACGILGDYAQRAGGYFAIETGSESAWTLNAFLNSLSSNGMAVNMDPANFVMVTDENPVYATNLLAQSIVHTHAKDGIMIQKTDPKIIYDYFAEGGINDLHLNDFFLETPLGRGNVDFPEYLKALKQNKYQGFLTIERETGKNPISDIKLAVSFLKELIRKEL